MWKWTQPRWMWVGTLGFLAAMGLLAAGHWVRAAGAEPGSSADPLVSKSYVDQWVRWQVLYLSQGQQLVAEAGVELVLRGGEATVVASPNGGLADVTGGTDLQQDQVVPPNHLLLVARSDGRGVLARTDAIFLIRGEYQVR